MTSKLYKNDIAISLFKVYLPKLLENILKYYCLDLFKEITIDFNYCFHTTRESPASLSNGLLVYIGKCWQYPCIQFIFGVAQFYWSLAQERCTHNNQGDWNLGSYVDRCWGDIVAEIFWQLRLVPPICMAWHWVLLTNAGSFSSHLLNPRQYYLFQALGEGLHVGLEAMWEEEWRHNVTIASDHPKHHDVNWVFGFINMNLSSDWHPNTVISSYQVF